MSRTVVVTGGGSGIGAACAQLLREQGWQVVVWDRVLPPGAGGQTVDVTDIAAVEVAAAQLERVDLLINAAGVPGSSAPTHEQDTADWDRVLAVCLSGTFYCCHALFRPLVAAGGVVVNIGSMRAELTAPGRAHYSVAKAGVHTLTRALGREWAPYGVRVVAVSPGYTRTPMIAAGIESGAIDAAALARAAPMDRLAEPAEVAAIVAALADPPFTFVTGTVLAVDGGSTA